MNQKELDKLICEENKRNEEIFLNQPFKRKLNPEKARKEDEKHRKQMITSGFMKRN